MMNEKKIFPDNVALSFKQLGIASLYPPKPILSNISGFVVRGGITAILGASASGKSVLMKVLAGRMPQFHTTGTITLEGSPMDPNDLQNSISYVPQDDFLMGELTPRETLTNAHCMKASTAPSDCGAAAVSDLLHRFGLDHVADNMIGTVFVRGLSGGQRKRVEVCSELVHPPTVLLLDEPTSGLDGSIAYEVLHAIREILDSKQGELSIILSIHQPNRRILDLFDHVLILNAGRASEINGAFAGGSQIFFGTVPESIEYFGSIGFPAPEGYTPTDVFLQVSDVNFGSHQTFDFEGTFACSKYAKHLHHFLKEVEKSGAFQALQKVSKLTSSVTMSDEEQGGGGGGDRLVLRKWSRFDPRVYPPKTSATPISVLSTTKTQCCSHSSTRPFVSM